MGFLTKNPKNHKDRYPYNHGRVPNWYIKKNTAPIVPQKIEYTIFTDEDLAKIEKMTTKEAIEYKKKLLTKI